MANYQSKHTGAEIDSGIDKANAALPRTGGTMTGALFTSGSPSSSFEVVNKKYVDDALAGIDVGDGGAAAVSAHNANATAHDARFAGKVDKIEGKALSSNDYTTADKNKLAGIAANANNYTHPSTHAASMITGLVSVEAIAGGQRLTITDADGAHVLDVLESTGGGSDGGDGGAAAVNAHNTSATAHASLFNAKVDKVTGKGLSTNDYTNAEKTKLAGIEDGANYYTHPQKHNANEITGLAAVATSGNYSDLSGKPTIPSVAGLASETYVDEQIAEAISDCAPATHIHGAVKIGTDVYTLRVGTEGAADYITFVME